MLVGIALVLGWDWLKVIAPPRLYPRYLTIGLLEAFLASYFVIVAVAALGVLVSAVDRLAVIVKVETRAMAPAMRRQSFSV